MKSVALIFTAALLFSAPSLAAETAAPAGIPADAPARVMPTAPAARSEAPDPTIAALGQIVGETHDMLRGVQVREAQALVRAATAEQRAASEKARADAAEAKLAKPDAAKAP